MTSYKRKIKQVGVTLVFFIFLAACLLLSQMYFSPASPAVVQGVAAALGDGTIEEYFPTQMFESARDPSLAQTNSAMVAISELTTDRDTQIAVTNLPIYYIHNQGQVDQSVKYYASGTGCNFYIIF